MEPALSYAHTNLSSEVLVVQRLLSGLAVFLFMAASVSGQNFPRGMVPPSSVPKENAPVAKVEGLTLPADQTVSADEGFVIIKATCNGTVRWLVLSQVKVKYIEVPGNTVIVAVPANAGSISVFCIGLVNSKLTDYAQTTVTVKPPTTPPNQPPGPQPPGVAGPYHVTFVVDMGAATPQMANLLNSPNIRTAITSKGNFLRVYDTKSPVLAQKKLDGLVQQTGGPPTVIIQRNDGFVVGRWKLPTTEQGIINLIQQNTGG